MQHAIACFVVLMIAAMANAAPPTTKPAAKPDPNTVAVEFKDLGFKLYVPKAWKETKRNAQGATFQVPTGAFLVITGPAKDEADLKLAIDDKKKRLAEKVKDVKFVTDQATKLAGHEAWELVYDVPTVARELDPKTNKELPGGKSIVVINRWLDVTSIKDGVLVQVSFVCSEKTYENYSKLARKALNTFEWTPRTAPAEQKK
jgi:hypothetical protein